MPICTFHKKRRWKKLIKFYFKKIHIKANESQFRIASHYGYLFELIFSHRAKAQAIECKLLWYMHQRHGEFFRKNCCNENGWFLSIYCLLTEYRNASIMVRVSHSVLAGKCKDQRKSSFMYVTSYLYEETIKHLQRKFSYWYWFSNYLFY